MKRLFHTSLTLFFITAILLANPYTVLADEGQDAVHPLEVEVNGYHVTLASQNEWTKGENIIVVTIADGMGVPLSNADVEILIAPTPEDHAEVDTHGAEAKEDPHAAEPKTEPAPAMDMGHGPSQEEAPSHEEETTDPIAMMESEHGLYVVETHVEASGEHEVHVMFHANGEMLQADFVIVVPGTGSKTVVLWSFALVNMALITSAGILSRTRKQSIPVKGIN